MSEPLIDAERVREITKDCSVTEHPSKDEVVVKGVAHTFGFIPAKLEEHRHEVATMLQGLPKEFRKPNVGGGGGWSFLNACNDANGEQWTGFHLTMESLFALGIALGLAEWVLPRDLWSVLPEGMPYVVVTV